MAKAKNRKTKLRKQKSLAADMNKVLDLIEAETHDNEFYQDVVRDLRLAVALRPECDDSELYSAMKGGAGHVVAIACLSLRVLGSPEKAFRYFDEYLSSHFANANRNPADVLKNCS